MSSRSMGGDDAGELALSWPEPGIALLTLQRPQVLNAVTSRLAKQILDALISLSADESCRVVVLTGTGRAFCAGADLRPVARSSESAVQPVSGDNYFNVIRSIRSCPLPVIAAVNGLAVGFGMAMTLAADIRIISRAASFGVGAVKLGLSAGESGISWHLPRLIGMSSAMEIMLTGRTVGAEEAAALGLGRLADDAVSAALQTAHAILANSPSAVKLTKEIVWANLEANFDRAMELEADVQYRAGRTHDFREAIAAFAEKRSPVFTGR